ncbi:MAG: hypothetical protein HFI19_06625 [Lachnospiraceae bacterium]|jgi:hypothetical protein|nr:hypothetical protein [Lachnospiraceae bacterium]
MEELTTERKQTSNTNITLNNIYNGIKKLKPEYQKIILGYKLPDLYLLFENNTEYQKYLKELIDNATIYINTFGALIALHKEALEESKRTQEFDILDTMNEVYDSLPEDKKIEFCENMLSKKEFFVDAYKRMMDTFESAIDTQKCEVVEGVAEN